MDMVGISYVESLVVYIKSPMDGFFSHSQIKKCIREGSIPYRKISPLYSHATMVICRVHQWVVMSGWRRDLSPSPPRTYGGNSSTILPLSLPPPLPPSLCPSPQQKDESVLTNCIHSLIELYIAL